MTLMTYMYYVHIIVICNNDIIIINSTFIFSIYISLITVQQL